MHKMSEAGAAADLIEITELNGGTAALDFPFPALEDFSLLYTVGCNPRAPPAIRTHHSYTDFKQSS